MEQIQSFLNYPINLGENITVAPKHILILLTILFIASQVIGLLKKIVTKRLPAEDRNKFNTVFSFGRWIIYTIILLITLNSLGINVTAIFAASAALLIGVGLALQTFFQDIISGLFIIIDQSIHIGDIIEIDGKVGRVDEIKLRTTRAITIDNKVLIIPNHKYLTSIVYNWTENGIETRENVEVGVAYGSDIELVKTLLLNVAKNHPAVLSKPEPMVLFTDFGDSALNFKLIFTLNNSFAAVIPKSDMRFEIDKVFREHNISIPFPQRDIHIIQKS